MRSRLSLIFVALAIAACAAVWPASASSSAPPIAILENCRPRAVIVPGVEELVRQKVPAQFELARDPLGRPLLAVVASRCERITVDDTTRPTTYVLFMAIIESPDGAGCLSQWPLVGGVKADLVPVCNFYLLFTAFDNRAMVKRIRSLVPDAPIRYVTGNVYEPQEFDLTRLGAPFRFRAGRRTPSPFELNGVVREGPVEGPATFFLWFTGSSGTVRFREDFADLTIGQMEATLRAAPGSEMAELLGTETPTPIAGLATRFHHDELRFLPPDSLTAADCKKDERSCEERDVNDSNDDRFNAGDPASTVQDTLDDVLHGDGNKEDDDEEDGDDDPNAGDPASTVQDTVDNILHTAE